MMHRRIFRRALISGLLLLVCLLPVGCSAIDTAIFPSQTPLPIRTSQPTRTPTSQPPSPTPEPSPTSPILWKTPVQPPAAPITPVNAAQLASLAVRGLGIPQAAAWSPSGDLLAVASTRGITIWSAVDGSRKLAIDDGTVRALAWSPDGRFLAGGRENGSIDLWDLNAADAAVRHLEGQRFSVLALAFSPDGLRLASAAWDGTLVVYTIEDGARVMAYEGMRGAARNLAFSPEGDLLFAWSPLNPLKAWDVLSGKSEKDRFTGVDASNRTGSFAAFTPQGDVFAVTQNRRVRLFHTADGTSLASITALSGDAGRVSIASGAELLAVQDSASIRLFQTSAPAAPSAVIPLPEEDASVGLLALSPDGKRLAWVGASLWLWENPLDQPAPLEISSGFNANPSLSAIPVPSSDVFIYPRSGGVLNRLNPLSGLLDATYTLPGALEGALALSPDLNQAAYVSGNNRLTLVDLAEGKPAITIRSTSRKPNALAFSPDGMLLAAAGTDQTLSLWSAADGELVSRLALEFKPAGLIFSPDGTTLAVWGGGELRRYQAPDWKESFAANGLGVVFAAQGEKQAVVQVKDGRMQTVLVNGGGQIAIPDGGALAFSPGGELLAVANASSLSLWDANSGTRLADFALDSAARSVQFDPDGKTISVLAWDGVVTLYGIR